MKTKIKICGVTTRDALQAAQDAGADFVGFVFFEKSPRNIDPAAAGVLAKSARLETVGLFVDPADDLLTRVLAHAPLRMIQLHGDETPARVAAIRSLTRLPVMKAVRVATRDDVTAAHAYAPVADWLLFDARVEGSHLPGGTGRNFDWDILKNYTSPRPWMLAGGLNPDNVGNALKLLTPDAVDVSSGVESAPGVKDASKIAAFVDSVRHA